MHGRAGQTLKRPPIGTPSGFRKSQGVPAMSCVNSRRCELSDRKSGEAHPSVSQCGCSMICFVDARASSGLLPVYHVHVPNNSSRRRSSNDVREAVQRARLFDKLLGKNHTTRTHDIATGWRWLALADLEAGGRFHRIGLNRVSVQPERVAQDVAGPAEHHPATPRCCKALRRRLMAVCGSF